MKVNEYLNLINSNKSCREIRSILDNYIPDKLYKYCRFPCDKTQRQERMSQLKHEKIWFSARKQLNDPFEFMNVTLNNCTKEVKEYYVETVREKGICCLTKNKTNELMWAHYADAYRGYCIEFKVESKSFIFPVFYTNAQLDLSYEYNYFYETKSNFQDIVNSRKEINYFKNLFKLKLLYRIKKECWKYEEEYRIFSTEAIADSSRGKLHESKLYGLKISGIIAGPFCLPKNIAELKKCIHYINVMRISDLKHKCNNLNTCDAIKLLKYNNDYAQLKQLTLTPTLEFEERSL